MPFALGMTAIVAGAILIYSGFKDKGIWDAFLALLNAK